KHALRDAPKRLRLMYDNMWYLRDARGNLPPIGDTEVSMPARTLGRIERQLRALPTAESDGRPIKSLGKRRQRRAASILYDAEAGFAIFKAGGRYAVFRIQDRASLSHAHNDALSLTLQIGGVD